MKIKIYSTNTSIEITVKDIYTAQDIIEVIDSGTTLALTLEDNSTMLINMMNVVAIQITK